MASYDHYLAQPFPMEEIVLNGSYALGLGAGLHDCRGHIVLSVMLDETSGKSIVVQLTDEQDAEVRSLLRLPGQDKRRAISSWLADVQIGDNEVLGWAWNDLIRALLHLGAREAPPSQ